MSIFYFGWLKQRVREKEILAYIYIKHKVENFPLYSARSSTNAMRNTSPKLYYDNFLIILVVNQRLLKNSSSQGLKLTSGETTLLLFPCEYYIFNNYYNLTLSDYRTTISLQFIYLFIFLKEI